MPNNYIDINGAQTLYNDLRGRAARAGGNLAAEYSTSATYSVGDYVIYKDKLYRCKTAVTTAGSWASNSSKFEVTNIGEETSALKSAFALFQENIPDNPHTKFFIKTLIVIFTNIDRLYITLNNMNYRTSHKNVPLGLAGII